jgi:hypothetical protein
MEEEQDIQSDIVKQKQLRDAQENQEFDREMDAYRRGRNLTDEQRKERLLDNARLKGNLLEAINTPTTPLRGSQFLDNIQGKIGEAGSAIMEAAQEDPDTWTDDAIRIGLGGVRNVGTVLGAPGIKQGLQLLGAPAYYVGRGLGYGLEKAGVDPRYGHIVGEVGEWFIPGYGMYKAAGKIVKTGKALNTLSNMTPLERGLAVGTVGAAKPIYKKGDLLKHAFLSERLTKQITGLPPERKLVSLRKSNNFKQLSENEKSNVIDMIGKLDNYITSRLNAPGFNPSKPSIGYTGQKDIITNGKVLSIRPKKGEYVLFNKTADQAIKSKRNIWDQPSSAEKGRVSNEFIWNSKKEYNADAKKILDHLLNSKHPEDQDLYYRIVGGSKPFQGEHIQYQKAGGNDPVWIEQPNGTFRHRSKLNAEGKPLAPGDIENLRLVGIYDFKYLKDGLEGYMEKGTKPLNNDYYLEMDRSNNIIIMHNKTGQYPDGQPFIRDTPVSPSTMNPYDVRKNWANDRDVTGLISIHRSSSRDEGIEAFNKIINRHSMEIKPRLSTDYRASFDSWFLDTEGGMAARELPGWDKVTKQLIEIDKNIDRLRRKLIKTKEPKFKEKLLEQIRSYENDALMLMKRHSGLLGTTVSTDGRQYPNIPLSTDDTAGQ